LDELPELWNILKGDMAIVGPRPLLVKYLPLYNKKQRRRHNVRPGLTGLAQVNGRNAISWEARFDLDVQYVERVTFVDDIKIIFQTVACVFGRKGIHSEGSETMEDFKGSPSEVSPISESEKV
jgi:lipopolysaccharide/colanic/teichoic acid biosynthesis glycosyltransferase